MSGSCRQHDALGIALQEPLIDHDDDARPLSPEQSAQIIAGQTSAVRRRTEPRPIAVLGTWGVAWVVGYLVLHTSARASGTPTPSATAYVVFGALLALALAVNVLVLARSGRGRSGPSTTAGVRYGISWGIASLAMSVVISGIARAGAGPELMVVISNAIPALVTGLMFLFGATIFDSRPLLVLGGWTVLVAATVAVVGAEQAYLLMALGGGGGLLAAAATHVVVAARDRADRVVAGARASGVHAP